MKYILKKIDFRVLNVAAWSTLLLAYFSQIRYIRLVEIGMGFPFEFITLYDISQGIDPIDTMKVHWGYFILNIVVIYISIYCINKLYKYVQNVILKIVNAERIISHNRNDFVINILPSTDEGINEDKEIVYLNNSMELECSNKSS